MFKTVVCVSGGGTNLQAIIDGIAQGAIRNVQIVRVISNNRKAYALENWSQVKFQIASMEFTIYSIGTLYKSLLQGSQEILSVGMAANRLA